MKEPAWSVEAVIRQAVSDGLDVSVEPAGGDLVRITVDYGYAKMITFRPKEKIDGLHVGPTEAVPGGGPEED